MTNTFHKGIWKGACSSLFLFILFIPAIIHAQDLSLNGFIRAYYFSSTRNLDKETDIFGTSFQPRVSLKFNPGFALYAEARLIAERPWDDVNSSLREGYGDIYLDSLDLRIGKQIVKWGRADGVNPTDNLTPWNYTLLFSDDNELRNGISAFKANYYHEKITVTAIWIPLFEPNNTPIPPQFEITKKEPSKTIGNSEYAFKIDSTGGLFDWSLSYFDGFDLMPDLALNSGIALRYPRIRVIGGDFASTIDKFGIRGEAAYFFTEDESGDDPQKKNPYLFYVLGVDRNLREDLYLNIQFIQRIVTNYKDPLDIQDPTLRWVAIQGALINNQLDRITNAVSLKIEYKMLYETLKAELATVYNLTRGDYSLRPKIAYAFTDSLSGTIGADIYEGKEDSFFGRFKDNSTIFAEFKYVF